MSNVLKVTCCLLFSLPFWGIWLYTLVPLPASFLAESQSTTFFDRNGEEITTLLSQKDQWKRDISFTEVSSHFLEAVLAVEDQNFFQHRGVDIFATLRAIRDNVTIGHVVSGASTITQQIARNHLQHSQRSLIYKVQEMLFAFKLEHHLTKAEILEQWINRVSFGGNIVGVESASQHIFGKSSAHIDLAEASFLAGIPQSPERLNAFENFEAVKKRQEFVLSRMQEEGFITQEQKEQAFHEELFIQKNRKENFAPHFITWLKNIQSCHPGLDPGPIPKLSIDSRFRGNDILNDQCIQESIVHTTLNLNLQKKVVELIELHIERLKKHHIQNAAALVWDIGTGEILTFVGNTDFKDIKAQGEVNILASRRAVGSTLKPFLYLLAFEKLKWTPETTIRDDPSSFGTGSGFFYEPQNYDLKFRGEISIRAALAESRNVPAVKTLERLGEQEFFLFLKELGISVENAQQNDFGLSAALGSFEITPLELAHAYGILARGGRDFEFRFLKNPKKITNEKEIADCSNAYQILDILSDNDARINSFGTENPLKFNFSIAAKTGTTRNFRDNWTVGFSDQIGVLVWVGNADGSPMKDVSGISGAGPLFHAVMEEAMRGRIQRKAFSFELICEGSQEITNYELRMMNESEVGIQDSEEKLHGLSTLQTFDSLRILSPLNGQTFLLSPEKPLESQKLEFRASEKVEWFVNRENIGSGKNILWIPQKGNIEITAKTQRREEKISLFIQ